MLCTLFGLVLCIFHAHSDSGGTALDSTTGALIMSFCLQRARLLVILKSLTKIFDVFLLKLVGSSAFSWIPFSTDAACTPCSS